MKKIISGFLLVALFSGVCFAKGGMGPCLASFFLDPRAGYMINDNNSEWVVPVVVNLLVGPPGIGLYACIESGFGAGCGGCCLSSCMTPTGWAQLETYKIRSREWLRLVPIYGLVVQVQDSLEAKDGVTWSEIVEEEGLKK